MGGPVFGNQVFDLWLTKKSQEILLKAEKEPIPTNEMLIVCLKSMTMYYDEKQVELERRFTRIENIMMWSFGLTMTAFLGVYYQLFELAKHLK